MKKIAIFLSLIFIIACAPVKMVKDPSLASPKFVMSKGACFGECPVYTFTLYNTGLMKFNGVRFTKMDGKYERQLDEATYLDILKKIDESNFWGLKDVYDMEIADLPTTSFSYSKKEKTKSIKGKAGLPDKLVKLEDYIENLVYSSEDWTMIEASPNAIREEAEIIENEIIIKGANNMILVKWLKKYKEYGVKIGRRLGPESEYWMIKYNTEIIEPAAMLKMIQDDPEIAEAEFNKVIKDRNRSSNY